MNYVKPLVFLVLASCTTTPPQLTRCTIINNQVAECVSKFKIEDKSISRMRGYICLSPDDVGAVKKYLIDLTEAIDNAQ